MAALRVFLTGLVLSVGIGAPLATVHLLGTSPGGFAGAVALGAGSAVHDVGFVLVPQALLAVAVLGHALSRGSLGLAGLAGGPAPAWLDPAIESALLLGLLGTISGMVSGFVGLSPEALEPGPLLHALGQALRSSFVGFAIALVGVWARPAAGSPA